MAIRRANTLTNEQLKQFLDTVARRNDPYVGRTKVLLSFDAGLRAQEITGLRWDNNLLNAVGEFKTQRILVPGANGKRAAFQERPILFVGSDIGKYGRERTIVMSPRLTDTLQSLKDFRDGKIAPRSKEEEKLIKRLQNTENVIPSGKRRAGSTLDARANAVTVWFHRLYEEAGFEDCSSHSGRRSFITEAARKANLSGCSLVDVQKLAGHASLNTTQNYVDVSASQAALVAGLWEG